MKKVLWFSRHQMSEEQEKALGEVQVIQVSKTISSARELAQEIKESEIIAVVAPIGLQAEFLKLAGEKPVIVAVSERVIVPSSDGGEDKVEFHFVKWERLLEVKVVKEDFKGV